MSIGLHYKHELLCSFFFISDCLWNMLNNIDTIEYIPLIGINTYGIVEAVVVVVGIISGK